MINKVDLDKLLKSKKISQRTYDKVTIAKQIIERKYNLKSLKNHELNTIFSKIDSLNISESKKEEIKQEILAQEAAKHRKLREKQSIRDYISLAIIGRGAFGEVHVCREKKTGQIVAVKKIKKEVLMIKNQVIHVRNEQLFMSRVKSPWIVELKASFQEGDFLYLVMEYLPGGDFMNLLIKKDILTEDEARFYTAELILAIESMHKLDCIHRDIKPDNILIDKSGHIKLSDFGLAKVSEKIFEINNNDTDEEYKPNTHQKNYSCVGTAYYVAPEVLNKKGYGPEIDWWSVGVIFFEMLIGYAPFCSKHTHEVCQKVLNWKQFLKIPSKKKVSKEAEDLIFKLINNANVRLGIGGAEEIKSHPFFKGVDWDNIRNTKAPFIPKLENDYDTSYFETIKAKEPFYPPVEYKRPPKRKDIEFMGYTYKEGDFDDIYNFENELMENFENMEYINRDNSNGESLDHSSNNSNSNSNLENGGKNKSNGIDKKDNNLAIHLEKANDDDNNNNNKVLMTKKICRNKNDINKIKNQNDNNNNILHKINYTSDKSNTISNPNNIMYTMSYTNATPKPNIQNNLSQNTTSKKFKKKINIQMNNNINNNKSANNAHVSDRNNPIKNLKTEPNNIVLINNERVIQNYLEYHSNHQNNTKLNVIKLPSKKIKDKSNKKIIIPENGASYNSISHSNDKYIVKKNYIANNLNRTKYEYKRFSPQIKDFMQKKFLILKSRSKKNNGINFNFSTTSASSEKATMRKNHLKCAINQNTLKKKYIGINSTKDIFVPKKNMKSIFVNNVMISSSNDTYNNNNNICLTERKNTMNTPNNKISYIYKKKL